MDDFLVGILGAALEYATPLPVSPDVTSDESADGPDVEYSDKIAQNDVVINSEQFTSTNDTDYLAEFDAYHQAVAITDEGRVTGITAEGRVTGITAEGRVTEKQDTSVSSSGIHSNVEKTLDIQYENLSNIQREDFLGSSKSSDVLTPDPEHIGSKVDEKDITARVRNFIKATLSSSSETVETTPSSKKKHTSTKRKRTLYNSEHGHESGLNLTNHEYGFGVPPNTDADAINPSVCAITKPEMKKKRTRKREINPDPTPPPQVLPPCRVCDDKSSGFHYGANTCEACKGFFRRTLKKKEVLFQCKCTEDEKGAWQRGPYKNGCPACRYERCLAIGMSKNAIKIGRYTLNRKTENIKEVKTLEAMDDVIKTAILHADHASSSSSSSYPASPMSFIDALSQPSPRQLSTLPTSVLTPSTSSCDSPIRLPQSENADDVTQFSQSPELTLKEIDTLAKILVDAHNKYEFIEPRNLISPELIKAKQDRCLERYTLKTAIFGNTTLSNSEYMEFFKTTGMKPDNRVQMIHRAMGFLQSRIAVLVGFAKCIPGFSELDIDDQATLIKESRIESVLLGGYRVAMAVIDQEKKVLVTPWGQDYHMDELQPIVPKEIIMRRYNLARELTSLELTSQEESVLRAIVIVSPDRSQLNCAEKAEQIQVKLFSCLQHLLAVRPGGAGNKLYKIFDLLMKFRELSDFQGKLTKQRLDEWPDLLSKHTLLGEFMR